MPLDDFGQLKTLKHKLTQINTDIRKQHSYLQRLDTEVQERREHALTLRSEVNHLKENPNVRSNPNIRERYIKSRGELQEAKEAYLEIKEKYDSEHSTLVRLKDQSVALQDRIKELTLRGAGMQE